MQPPAPRFAAVVAAAVLGFLAVLAATRPAGSPRELRRFELADLAQLEDARVRALRAELVGLRAQIEELEAGSGAASGELRRQIRSLSISAGTAPLEGPGVVVTLDDSSAARSPTGDPNDLIVHEADIQTVVNGLWAAGAEVLAINGERLTATSAVRCAGNTLLLHGTLHTPPYQIAAIGEPATLAASFARQPGVDRLAASADAFGLGLDITTTTVRIGGGPPSSPLVAAQPMGIS
jgi:uncharacterized protein YlxW (UPF0749 family)